VITLPPFQRLLDDHGHDVHRYLVLAAGRVDADDCYQETLLAALRAYPRLRSADNLRGWLFTIATRKAIDAHRARGRRAVPVAEPPEMAHAVGTSSIDDRDVWRAVAELPPKQREAVTRRFLGDESHDQIGDAMGITAVAARRNVHEGLKKLREARRP
jgi:RNA polymerase sigma factor (sigma-70 family)